MGGRNEKDDMYNPSPPVPALPCTVRSGPRGPGLGVVRLGPEVKNCYQGSYGLGLTKARCETQDDVTQDRQVGRDGRHGL